MSPFTIAMTTEPYHGINLFFNGSTVPQISAYQPTACGAGPPSPYAGTSLGLAGTVPAAGSLRCVVDGLEIELAGYLWSQPSCAELDVVSPLAWSPDGANDFMSVFMLSVTEVPRLSITLTETNTAVLAWPSPSTGYGLERASALPPSSWTTVTNTPSYDGFGTRSVTLPVEPASELFRLVISGYRGLPKALAYGPTQAALINLAQTLWLDLSERGIGVSVVNPGFVVTPLTAQNDIKMPALLTPEQAADEILAGWAAGRFEIHFPKGFTLWVKALSHLGDASYFRAVRRATGL